MKTGLSESTTNRRKPLKARFRSQFSVFLLFVVFSSLVWIVIKLSRDFTSTIIYQVEYENPPPGKILIQASDSTITIGLDAQGFDLISYHLWQRIPMVKVDLSGIKMQADENSYSGYILTSGLSRKIASQLGAHNELVSIAPDTLKFKFKQEYSKWVTVVPQVQYQLRPQYMLYEPVSTEPDSILVSGPKEIVDTLDFVPTAPMNFSDLHANQSVLLVLQKPSNLPLTYSSPEVEVRLNVEKYTEKAFDLPVNIDCPEGDIKLRIFPETVTVHCRVALKDYKRLEPGMFKAVVSCQQAELQGSTKLRVKVLEYPSFAAITRTEPERVEFILVKERE